MKKIKNKNYAGFSLIEALIATVIVAFMSITFFTILARTFNNEKYQKEYVIAANLAQEGIEIVRNIRDNNLKSGLHAFDNFPMSCDDTEPLCDNMNDFIDLGFHRSISITPSGDAMIIKSEVAGPNSGIDTTVEDTLYPWGDKE